MEKSQANLEVFATTLLELAHQDSNLLVVTSDSRGSGKLAPRERGDVVIDQSWASVPVSARAIRPLAVTDGEWVEP